MKHIILWATLLALLPCSTGASPQSFDQLKIKLAESGCLEIHFSSLIYSAVFESTDSLAGSATIEREGRYRISLGDDRWIYDGTYLFAFSLANNQVTVEKPSNSDQAGEMVTFLRRLDEHFQTEVVEPNMKYELTRKATAPTSLPDSMTVELTSQMQLKRISYLDLNEDINRIEIDSVLYSAQCDSTLFMPDFPDSVETVRLY